MKEESSFCFYTTPSPGWDKKAQQFAERSFRCAHLIFSYISAAQTRERSTQELSMIAQDTISEFMKLVSLLDASILSDHKRIRKGPLPNFTHVNPNELMDYHDFLIKELELP
uniref:Uncharacterized protein n=1 Tax=Nelumbo nucifera TaxID=4432 RepID=A0A822ZRG0_NELNU|nr:TPA_asm: hypothetical protein HUJ06_017769 [Nelumbo nucifera]